ncbi:hypothetical protein E4S40_10665 [Algoriphagus kandeliae]|uniref:BT4734-like N-terminal domain-containing protein n=1 Tax=Algoriphagus kandeliae TaxID=2562278 RepID=A0A4Y9QU53_9BACT|nr:CRISPR-associated primase-polymerase type B [Algoriphagus kandeliae]TFV94475.1 hypothetical protein E4S40_10665 [Algoriphagus kandeliae]
MIRLGKHITQAGDQLYDVSIEKLHKALINPQGEVASLQRKLQAIRAMDPNQYRKMKTSLPYIVCAQFHPKARRKENFLFTERFLIDIDHLSDHELNIQDLRKKFAQDERVELMFSSPSGDGLKLLFKIDPKISDSSYYVLFYKAFCIHLEKKYLLGTALDHKTHDVSRCCFVSFDPEAYFNTNAKAINPADFVRKDSFLDLEQVQFQADQILKSQKEIQKVELSPEKSQPGQDLSDEILAFIKEKTGQRTRNKTPEKYFEQPEELEKIIAELQVFLDEVNSKIENIKPISYGRQIKVSSGNTWAEINVFFGKKGVSIVPTTKTGSHREFAKTITDYLKASFSTY